jgi:hypothetical protein
MPWIDLLLRVDPGGRMSSLHRWLEAKLPGPRPGRRRPDSLTAHLGLLTVTLRRNRSSRRLETFPRSRHVGSLGVGLLAVSWLRRPPGGGRRWGLESVPGPRRQDTTAA